MCITMTLPYHIINFLIHITDIRIVSIEFFKVYMISRSTSVLDYLLNTRNCQFGKKKATIFKSTPIIAKSAKKRQPTIFKSTPIIAKSAKKTISDWQLRVLNRYMTFYSILIPWDSLTIPPIWLNFWWWSVAFDHTSQILSPSVIVHVVSGSQSIKCSVDSFGSILLNLVRTRNARVNKFYEFYWQPFQYSFSFE